MKIWNYVFIAVTLVIILEIAGIGTGLDGIQSLISFNFNDGMGNFSASALFLAILGSAGALIGVGVGIAIGFLTKGTFENYIILGFITGTLGVFIQTFISIINEAKGQGDWIYGIVLIIFAPIVVGYMVALVEFFRGTD